MPRCTLCGEPIPDGARPWHGIHGWERKALAGSRKSGSDIAAREPLPDELAHDHCVRLLQAGLNVNQQALL